MYVFLIVLVYNFESGPIKSTICVLAHKIFKYFFLSWTLRIPDPTALGVEDPREFRNFQIFTIFESIGLDPSLYNSLYIENSLSIYI